MTKDDIIKSYAHPDTRRIINRIGYFARQERRLIERHRRGFWASSVGLAMIFIVEYAIAYAFIATALSGLDAVVTAPVLALIVPMAAFAFHLRTTHDTETRLRDRLRAFVTVALLILPIALSLGLAVEVAGSVVSSGGGNAGGTIGGETIMVGAPETGIAESVLAFLRELAPLLLLVLAASLSISFYVASFLFRKVEKHYGFINLAENRTGVALDLVGRFQDGRQEFERLERDRARELRRIPTIPEEAFADELAVAVNKKVASMRKAVTKHRPGAEGRDVFTETLDRVSPLPWDITTLAEANERLNRIKDNLRPQAVVAALGAMPPKEFRHDG
jgi:hypothetical protein